MMESTGRFAPTRDQDISPGVDVMPLQVHQCPLCEKRRYVERKDLYRHIRHAHPDEGTVSTVQPNKNTGTALPWEVVFGRVSY